MIDDNRIPETGDRIPKADAASYPVSGIPSPCVVAVLAAGSSTRMGRPKQLIEWHGATLIRHAAQTALDAAIGPVVVILGAGAEACLAAVTGMPLDEVIHTGWAEGMGSSVAVAAAYAHAHHPEAGALLLMACDQPKVTAADLIALRDAR
jgi:molybdenum cofactor cytidylyltransferase